MRPPSVGVCGEILDSQPSDPVGSCSNNLEPTDYGFSRVCAVSDHHVLRCGRRLLCLNDGRGSRDIVTKTANRAAIEMKRLRCMVTVPPFWETCGVRS